jgi:hypothetical protein
MVIPLGAVPAANVETPIGVNAPVVPLIVNADTSLEPWLHTYRKDPFGDTATPLGAVPAATGAPIPVNAPVVPLIVNADTLLEP